MSPPPPETVDGRRLLFHIVVTGFDRDSRTAARHEPELLLLLLLQYYYYYYCYLRTCATAAETHPSAHVTRIARVASARTAVPGRTSHGSRASRPYGPPLRAVRNAQYIIPIFTAATWIARAVGDKPRNLAYSPLPCKMYAATDG